MKILYIGHYKENSGWSNAAINNILALDSIGLDVVCRNIKLTNTKSDTVEKIEELEQKDLNDVEYCIQHVLPHHMVATNKFKKNVAYFVHESSNIKHTPWYSNLRLMDEVWVPSNYSKTKLESEGLHTRVLPHTFEVFNYQTIYKKLNFGSINNHFKFYTIADVNDRKNIDAIIKCFYSEFTKLEPVALVLKLKKHGYNENTLVSFMHDKIKSIQKELRIHANESLYPEVKVLPQSLTNDQIYSLHQTCDCFVGISHGEGWSIPAFEAMCFGKTPICSNEGGPSEFINISDTSTGSLIDGVYGVCSHSDPAFPFIFTGREEWFVPDESQTKKMMRYYYENKDNIDRNAGIKQARSFDYTSIAQLIREYLDD